MIGVLSVTIATVSLWWVMRQTVWNVWAPAIWRLSLIGLELFITLAFIVGKQETDPLVLRVGWSVLNLLVLLAFAYYFDHKGK
jgi:hypothetical protein